MALLFIQEKINTEHELDAAAMILKDKLDENKLNRFQLVNFGFWNGIASPNALCSMIKTVYWYMINTF